MVLCYQFPQSSQPYRRTGFTIFLKKSICSSIGKLSILIFFSRENIALLACSVMCLIAFLKDPLLDRTIPRYLYSFVVASGLSL